MEIVYRLVAEDRGVRDDRLLISDAGCDRSERSQWRLKVRRSGICTPVYMNTCIEVAAMDLRGDYGVKRGGKRYMQTCIYEHIYRGGD